MRGGARFDFKKQTVARQQLIRDGLYYSSDEED